MTEEQRTTLKTWVGAKTSPQRTVLRARICLLAADGLPNRSIAKNLKTSRPTVAQWRKRFEKRGPEGLAEDAPHGLSSRALSAEKIKAIVEATLHTTPPDALFIRKYSLNNCEHFSRLVHCPCNHIGYVLGLFVFGDHLNLSSCFYPSRVIECFSKIFY